MLLTLTTTHRPATDLGFLLHKNPARVQSFPLSFGKAHVYYPEASPERCTAALLLDVDPVWLVRGRRRIAGEAEALGQYVNDRPFVASSFLSVAIAAVFGSALAGRSRERPELAGVPLPLEARIAALPCRGGAALLDRLFTPLGYAVDARPHALDPAFAEWGESPYLTVSLSARCRLADLLAHLYVLVPVLDDEKHYWVGEDELEKLLRHGEGWLRAHPERERIADRYLRHRQILVRAAIARLVEDDGIDPDEREAEHASEEASIEGRLRLADLRVEAVVRELRVLGARRVVDLGCGDGRLVEALLEYGGIDEIAGMDVSFRALEAARARLRLDRLPASKARAVKLLHGSLTYRDPRIAGYDAAAVVEVIEHLDPPRLVAFERVLFEQARPRAVVLTTPNADYNVRFDGLAAGRFRHRDHRFEWTREQFRVWAGRLADRFRYSVRFAGVGPEDPEVGSPTQMGVFHRDADRS